MEMKIKEPFSYPVQEEETPEKLDAAEKKVRWKRKLLDLSTRSSLVHIPADVPGKKAVMIWTADIYQLYQKMQTQVKFRVTGYPEESEDTGSSRKICEQMSDMDICGSILAQSFEKNILHTSYEESTVSKLLSSLRRDENELISQTGTDALFMTFGALGWKDQKSGKTYDAPMVLMPVKLIKEGRIYRIVYNGNEIYLNETILELLRGRFEIRPAGLNRIPKDAAGNPDLAAILYHMRKAVLEEPDLRVKESVSLGLYTFGQYVMWQDLNQNMEQYSKHPLIKSMLEGQLDQKVNEYCMEIDQRELYLPVEVDGTQQQAVKAAAEGRSFVMHGPPGTGKSQTITAILSVLTGQLKSVLFAAQKAAALEVVYDRMKKAGLGRFCLYLPELDTGSAGKELFLRQLKESLETCEFPDDEFEKWKKTVDQAEQEIERQVKILHASRVCGFSAYSLLAEYSKLEEDRTGIELPEEFTDTLSQKQMQMYEEMLKELTQAGSYSGHPGNHPLRDLGFYEYRVSMQNQVRPALAKYLDALERLEASVNRICQEMNCPAAETLEDIRSILVLAEKLKKARGIPKEILTMEHPEETLRSWIDSRIYQAALVHMQKLCDESLLDPKDKTCEEFYRSWQLLKGESSPMAGYKRRKLREEISKKLKIAAADDSEMEKNLAYVIKFRKIPVPPEVNLEFSMSIDEAERILALIHPWSGQMEELRKLKDGSLGIPTEKSAALLKEAIQCVKTAGEAVRESGMAEAPLWHLQNISLKDMKGSVRRWISGLNVLREWSDYQKEKENCLRAGLQEFVSLYEQGMDQEKLLRSFRATVCYTLLNRLYQVSEEVRKFAGYRFEELLKNYKQYRNRFSQVSRMKICMKLQKRKENELNNPENAEELAIIRKIIENNGKGMTIRGIIEKIPHLLRILKPCILLNPMMAAQYLDPSWPRFSSLIFDEASQIQTCKAVGLIARARQVIAAGDPNQMPPSNYFDCILADEEMDPLEEDQESILKEFLALGLPEISLQWHYRSRHESLIAFSNHRYYGGKMVTFPSADQQISRVRLVPVDGRYKRGHGMTNKTEAQACVDYLIRKLEEGDGRSYGIVTFNKNQKDMIERLVEKRADQSKRFREKLDALETRGEKVFVRNLENVQGDERDVILFSTGYGPDEEGKVTMNFGPLLLPGGYRRLNVAITRARDEMVIFSSLPLEKLRTGEGTARGVRDFADFLKFAAGTYQPESEDKLPEEEDGFQKKIGAVLKENGYAYDTNVGSSHLKIDLAVRDPENPGRYILGIMLNNLRYYQNPCTYDREIGQFQMMEERGWKILRIWSVDWWEDPRRETDRILGSLKLLTEKKGKEGDCEA